MRWIERSRSRNNWMRSRRRIRPEVQQAEGGAPDSAEISASGAEAQVGGDVKAKSADKAAAPPAADGKPPCSQGGV